MRSPNRAVSQTLTFRLAAAVLIMPLLFVLVSYLWIDESQAASLSKTHRDHAQVLAKALANGYSRAPASIQAALNALPKDAAIEEIRVDDGGKRVASLGETLSRERDAVWADTVEGGRVSIYLSQPNDEEELLQESRTDVRTMAFLFLAFTLGVVGGVAYRFNYPLALLASTAQGVASGKIDVEEVESIVRVGTLKELSELRSAFRELCNRLAQGLSHEQARHSALKERVAELQALEEKISAGESPNRGPMGEPPSPAAGPRESPSHDDPFAVVALGLGRMAQALAEHHHKLEEHRLQREEYQRALLATNERLMETDKYKNEFLSVVSHELRTPLTAIKAFAEILLEETPETQAELVEFISIIGAESQRLNRIINHLLDISRIESGRMPWRKEKIAMVAWLKVQVPRLQKLFPQHKLRLHIGPSLRQSFPSWIPGAPPAPAQEAPPEVEIDIERFYEDLLAILDNAARHAPEQSKIGLTLRRLGEHSKQWLLLEISDEGPGVHPEHHELIFSKFQRMRLGDHRGGTGLSLALARAVIEAQGGRLQVESAGKQGSRFLYTLPLVPSNSPPEGLSVTATRLP